MRFFVRFNSSFLQTDLEERKRGREEERKRGREEERIDGKNYCSVVGNLKKSKFERILLLKGYLDEVAVLLRIGESESSFEDSDEL
jgi:hypothetical protein